MSPVKKKERIATIDRERFKTMLKSSKYSQREIAEMLFTTEAYLSRRLKLGNIDKEWFNKICEWLDISPEYLSGESPIDAPWVSWKRKKINGSDCIRDFMLSRGFSKDFTENLTSDNLNDIEMFIVSMVKNNGESPLEVGRDNMDNLANQVKELEDRIKELESKND